MEIRLFDHARGAFTSATVYRALREDVVPRFVAIGPGDGYETAYEDGDPDGAGGVLLIEPFAVPPDDDEGFLAAWHEARTAFAGAPGHLGTRLCRAVAAAEPRWVQIARWSSPLLFARAGGEGALYLPADE